VDASFETLLVERVDRLLIVTLNRPDSLNAINGDMHHELDGLFQRVRDDEMVGAVLLRGAGRAFSAGGDVKGMANTAAGSDGSDRSEVSKATAFLQSKRLLMSLLDVEQPIVSAVHGYAFGIGATLALCCDVVVAAEDAVFADTHVGIGLVAGDGGGLIWPLLLPINTAKYYLMTGDRITGADAERLGLIVRAVPPDQLEQAATEIAGRLAAGPTLAIKWTKMAVNKVLRERANLVFDTSLLLQGMTRLSEDHQEATAAFVEKRKPVYRGR
jgi:enoyl-CoA hydratase